MQTYQRKPVLVHVFRIPPVSEASPVELPDWLMERMESGRLFLNSFGGLTERTPWGVHGCMPGDYVALTERDKIEFIAQDDFEHEFEAAA